MDDALVYMGHDVHNHFVSALLISQKMEPIARGSVKRNRTMFQIQNCDLIRSHISKLTVALRGDKSTLITGLT